MTDQQPQYPTCLTCGHAARHATTNIRRCDECGGPCVTEEGWRSFGIQTPWPGRRPPLSKDAAP